MVSLLRVRAVVPLDGFRVRLTLTDDSVVEREVGSLLVGPVFEPVRGDPAYFRQVKVEAGTLVWPNGADLCPDVLIWGGPPPVRSNAASPQATPAETTRAT